jgi:hypothetical protein
VEEKLNNQLTVFEKIEEKIDRVENRVSGMRTEFRGTLQEILGEIEEVGIQVSVGQRQIRRWLKGIFFAICGVGVAVIGLQFVSQFLDRRGKGRRA